MHVDNPDWGFSNKDEGVLDMRYDKVNSPKSAADVVKIVLLKIDEQIFTELGERS